MALGSLANSQNGSKTQVEQFTDTTVKSNSKVVEAIEGLKEDFAALVGQVGRLQVVMDTGTLVGAIGPEMDKNLGQRTKFNRRGI